MIMTKEREICGTKVIVSGETYNEYKGTLQAQLEEKDKEIERLNYIIKSLDEMFEYYFLGNLKYDQDTVNTIYIKYVKLKELKEGK